MSVSPQHILNQGHLIQLESSISKTNTRISTFYRLGAGFHFFVSSAAEELPALTVLGNDLLLAFDGH